MIRAVIAQWRSAQPGEFGWWSYSRRSRVGALRVAGAGGEARRPQTGAAALPRANAALWWPQYAMDICAKPLGAAWPGPGGGGCGVDIRSDILVRTHVLMRTGPSHPRALGLNQCSRNMDVGSVR